MIFWSILVYKKLSAVFNNSDYNNTMINEKHTIKLAFIGGGNMASAISAGLIGRRCAASDVLVIEPNHTTSEKWQQQGVQTASAPIQQLAQQQIWVFAVKPQQMKAVVKQCAPFLQSNTLIISVAAGIAAKDIAHWLSRNNKPHSKVIRCMPNTPAFIGCGATGLMALDGVSADDKEVAEMLFKTVGEFVWVANDQDIDSVTALSGSGPAYVFLFLESLIQGGIEQGLTAEQARKLAFATVSGATQLAALSPLALSQLRDNVTSEGGTTAAALKVFDEQDFTVIIHKAMQAAKKRAAELADEFSK